MLTRGPEIDFGIVEAQKRYISTRNALIAFKFVLKVHVMILHRMTPTISGSGSGSGHKSGLKKKIEDFLQVTIFELWSRLFS